MTDFAKTYAGYRFAKTRYGDTLQRIALRELGDAAMWSKLVWFNGLVAPFITDDASQASSQVLLTGTPIKIPASTAQSKPATDGASNVLLTDCQLTSGQLSVDSATGDLSVVSGRANLKQALENRIKTDPGEILFHPEYGCKIGRRRGNKNTSSMVLLGRMDVQDALVDETRLKTIDSITATASGDVLAVVAQVTPISGDSVTIEATV